MFFFLFFLLLLPVIVFLGVLAAMFYTAWGIVKLCFMVAEAIVAWRANVDERQARRAEAPASRKQSSPLSPHKDPSPDRRR